MKNFTQPGRVITLVAPHAVTSGQGAQVGSIFGVAGKDIANGVSGDFTTEGCFDLTKTTGEAWTQGQLLYWNSGTRAVTSTVGSNLKIGVATGVVGSAAAVGNVRLNGSW